MVKLYSSFGVLKVHLKENTDVFCADCSYHFGGWGVGVGKHFSHYIYVLVCFYDTEHSRERGSCAVKVCQCWTDEDPELSPPHTSTHQKTVCSFERLVGHCFPTTGWYQSWLCTFQICTCITGLTTVYVKNGVLVFSDLRTEYNCDCVHFKCVSLD
jgi:hypothetical protein